MAFFSAIQSQDLLRGYTAHRPVEHSVVGIACPRAIVTDLAL
jgi:hypothetical protein